jgi:hypothetical protein
MMPSFQLQRMIHLLTAYRQTGKDTFLRSLTCPDESIKPWHFYGPPGVTTPPIPNGIRIAFADEVKRLVHEEYCLDPTMESEKDRAIITHPISGKQQLLRHAYIEIALQERNKDINVWCRRALRNWDSKTKVTVTDWRFPNELEFVRTLTPDVTTWRLFRSEVSIPESETEHQLDTYPTDWLLVTSELEFERAIQQFPQYRDYVHIK